MVPTSIEVLSQALSEPISEALGRSSSRVMGAYGRHGYEFFMQITTTEVMVDLFFVHGGCEQWTLYRTLLNGYSGSLPPTTVTHPWMKPGMSR